MEEQHSGSMDYGGHADLLGRPRVRHHGLRTRLRLAAVTFYPDAGAQWE